MEAQSITGKKAKIVKKTALNKCLLEAGRFCYSTRAGLDSKMG
jgi:hypothetical protein